MASTIVKVCMYHGPLDENQANKSKKTNGFSYRCKQCQKESHKKHYEANKEHVKTKQKQYREENKEKVREIKRASYRKHGYKYNSNWKKYRLKRMMCDPEKEQIENTLRKRKARETLTDGYVRNIVVRRSNLKHKDIPQQVVDFARQVLLLKRKLKEIKDGDKEHK